MIAVYRQCNVHNHNRSFIRNASDQNNLPSQRSTAGNESNRNMQKGPVPSDVHSSKHFHFSFLVHMKHDEWNSSFVEAAIIIERIWSHYARLTPLECVHIRATIKERNSQPSPSCIINLPAIYSPTKGESPKSHPFNTLPGDDRVSKRWNDNCVVVVTYVFFSYSTYASHGE